MFKLNLKIALRNLWKSKGFALINIGGLAIGLACCLLLLLYVSYEWSYDRQFKNIDRIYSVYDNNLMSDRITTDQNNCTPTQLAPYMLETMPGVEHVSRLSKIWDGLVSYGQNNFKRNIYCVDPSFLKMFDYKFIKGDPSTALANPNSILITDKTAKIIFGDEDPIGKGIKLDNRKEMKVTAVVEDMPYNQTLRFDMLMSWNSFAQDNPWTQKMDWYDGAMNTLVQLKDNRDFDVVDKQLRDVIKIKDPTHNVVEYFLFPFKKAHLYDQFTNGKSTGGGIDQIRLFLLLAFCVLLIACINYMNLSTARSEKRAREVGVRKALGSSRGSLAAQFMVESLLLSFLAMLIAFILLESSVPYFNNLLGIHMSINYGAPLFWVALLGLLLFTGLIAGSYPAFYLSSFIPVKVLKGFKGVERSSLPIRKILVVLQFGFSICMIICAIVIYRQINFIKNAPLGFNADNLMQLPKVGELAQPGKTELFKEELLKSGVITSATESSAGIAINSLSTHAFKWPGKQENEQVIMNFRYVGANFTKTIGAKILLGRDFSKDRGADSTSVLLNESAVKAMQLKTPIGSKITNGESHKTFTVIGVMKDYTYERMGANVSPTLFMYPHQYGGTLILRLNPEQNLSRAVQLVKEINQRINPTYPAELTPVSWLMENKLRSERILSFLSNMFGAFAIFISCLGLLGLALYMAEQRSKEISIRKVLGAQMGDILVLLNKDFMKLVVIANLIACPMAYIAAHQWLQKYDKRADMTAWPFVLAILLSVLIAILTVSLQTLKVAKAKAIDSLKYE